MQGSHEGALPAWRSVPVQPHVSWPPAAAAAQRASGVALERQSLSRRGKWEGGRTKPSGRACRAESRAECRRAQMREVYLCTPVGEARRLPMRCIQMYQCLRVYKSHVETRGLVTDAAITLRCYLPCAPPANPGRALRLGITYRAPDPCSNPPERHASDRGPGDALRVCWAPFALHGNCYMATDV